MKFKILVGLLIIAGCSGFLIGCNGGTGQPESIASADRVSQLVEMRKLFDQAKGDWATLSPAEQEQYTKLAGDAEKAKAMWASMANPSGAVPGAK